MEKDTCFCIDILPAKWKRLGRILERGCPGEFDSNVTGDPCIVWDDARNCYHMFYFAQRQVDGKEVNCNGHAVSTSNTSLEGGNWKKCGELTYTNPEALLGDTHKPWILMDPYRPNTASTLNGLFWLFTASFNNGRKTIQIATAAVLDGPWTIIEDLVIAPGDRAEVDGFHVDAPTAYYFEQEHKILIFYMGYPYEKQIEQPLSPYGSCSCVACLETDGMKLSKLGVALRPSLKLDSWARGYIGGLQLFKAKTKGWYALINASPTSPCSVTDDENMREPAPSLGGWAYTEEAFPDKGWQVLPHPIEYIHDIPDFAIADGEGENLWRHHLVVLPDRTAYCLYNSGRYGSEQMFGKRTQFCD